MSYRIGKLPPFPPPPPPAILFTLRSHEFLLPLGLHHKTHDMAPIMI